MRKLLTIIAAGLTVLSCATRTQEREPVDWVNTNIGGISHLLVPTWPTVGMPGGMVRFLPRRGDYTSVRMGGFPLTQVSHRGAVVFALEPWTGTPQDKYTYDLEKARPYEYSVFLEEPRVEAAFAPGARSGIWTFRFMAPDGHLTVRSRKGSVSWDDGHVSGTDVVGNTTVYLSMDVEGAAPDSVSAQSVILKADAETVCVRYGISFIDAGQARANLDAEAASASAESHAKACRKAWNDYLGKIRVEGASDDEKSVFYTALYRIGERMVDYSEDGRHYSGFDGQVHEGPYWSDDWFWDTYRAAHPFRTLLDPDKEAQMIASVLEDASLTDGGWLPTFPQITGDSHAMNCNHGIAVIADAIAKGLPVDAQKAFEACEKALRDKTLSPWSAKPAGALDRFFWEKGWFPALRSGEKETCPEVHSWEKRQPVAVTLGTAYDSWCLAEIAKAAGMDAKASEYQDASLVYRNIFNPETRFFHPKDADGKFITPFDYKFSGGYGFRDAYDENNGWIYRWDVQHNISDLISLHGGPEAFCADLDAMFEEPLGMSRNEFLGLNPDHSALVGIFSMGNEPCMHIPYLYTYAGEPAKTQKYTRNLLRMWFRNDLMGLPGDEDGGGMSAFVAFSMLGFYPVTPGLPVYVITSPVFEKATIATGNGTQFSVTATNYDPDNRYIQDARLNGQPLGRPWITHEEIMHGGSLELLMGRYPSDWGSEVPPPSFQMPAGAGQNLESQK